MEQNRCQQKRGGQKLVASRDLGEYKAKVQDGPWPAFPADLTSIAIDPQFISLGAPVFISTTFPNTAQPLRRLMLAQDTGGAIRNPVRADLFWGFGAEAGELAGRMKQSGQMWVLLPRTLALQSD